MARIRVLRLNCVRVNCSSARFVSASFLSLLSLWLGCTQLAGCQGTADGVGLLAQPPVDQIKFSSYSPAAPYTQQAPGVLTRRAFVASSGSGYRVEVQDLLVGPRQTRKGITLAGPALVEVRAGNAVMTAGDRKQELKPGLTFSLPEGTALVIDNDADASISLRAHVFIAE